MASCHYRAQDYGCTLSPSWSRPIASGLLTTLLLGSVFGGGCRADPRRNAVLDAFAMNDRPLHVGGHFRQYDPPPEDKIKDQALRRTYIEYKGIAPGSSVARRTTLRNEIAETMMVEIKHYHDGTSDDLYEITSSLESWFDLLGLAVNGVGAVTGGAAEKSAYNAAGAGLIGFRNALGKNILAEQTKFAVIQQMSALRTVKEAQIRTTLAQKTDDDYALRTVLTDLYDLFTAGSVKDAVSEMARAAQEAKTDADKKKTAAVAAQSNGAAGTRGALAAEARLAEARATADSAAATAKGTAEGRRAATKAGDVAASIKDLRARLTATETALETALHDLGLKERDCAAGKDALVAAEKELAAATPGNKAALTTARDTAKTAASGAATALDTARGAADQRQHELDALDAELATYLKALDELEKGL